MPPPPPQHPFLGGGLEPQPITSRLLAYVCASSQGEDFSPWARSQMSLSLAGIFHFMFLFCRHMVFSSLFFARQIVRFAPSAYRACYSPTPFQSLCGFGRRTLLATGFFQFLHDRTAGDPAASRRRLSYDGPLLRCLSRCFFRCSSIFLSSSSSFGKNLGTRGGTGLEPSDLFPLSTYDMPSLFFSLMVSGVWAVPSRIIRS